MPNKDKNTEVPQCDKTDVSRSVLYADAICLVCGVTKQDGKTGFCVNNHDDWLELEDEAERFVIASKKFNLSIPEIIECIKTNTCIGNE